MSNILESVSIGKTPSEQYLAQLARRSFLTMWCYPNVFTDEGRHNCKGDGKELCDLLVVFDNHVLIFSDKHCLFTNNDKIEITWKRWYRRAIEKSARQLLGARNWLMRFPDRIFLDKKCEMKFPLQLPEPNFVEFHLIAVTHGTYDACRNYFARQSTGSLMIDTSLVDKTANSKPFTVGQISSEGTYIHVLDELTLDVVLRELDTIKDLVEYLQKKEKFLMQPARTIVVSGEEQLVAMYLTHLDSEERHGFNDIQDDFNLVYIDEGHWEGFIKNPQYVAKKHADQISYTWDRLIEHLTERGEAGFGDSKSREISQLEPALRVLAAESRLARRHLSDQLLDALSKEIDPGHRFLRLGYSKQSSDTAYVFLVLPCPKFIESQEKYRESRRAMLLACCKVARLRAKLASRIIGIATEPAGTRNATEDLVLLEVQGEAWGPEEEEEARMLQQEIGILSDDRVKYYERSETEYPEYARPMTGLSPAKRLLERARIKRLEKLSQKPRKQPIE